MKWMRERDLLIAQTMAFVQSVTGKTPEAEKTVTTSVALLSVEASETIRAATPLPDIKSLLAETPPAAQAPQEDLYERRNATGDIEASSSCAS